MLLEHPAVRALLETLIATIRAQQEEMERLRAYLQQLEHRLNLDSHNSSQPPSGDWDRGRSKKRIVNLRTPSGKKPGGQEGHPGSTLSRVSVPDRGVVHPIEGCSRCGRDLSEVEAREVEKRQVFDLPLKLIEVTEHPAPVKECPGCHGVNRGGFPAGVDHGVHYGARLRGVAVYLYEYQLIPYERVGEVFLDVLGHSLSQGTLLNGLSEMLCSVGVHGGVDLWASEGVGGGWF